MYDHILVPTDGSPGSRKAVRHAVDFAEQYGADLHSVYVVETERTFPMAGTMEIDGKLKEQADRALAEVEEIADEAEIPVKTAIRKGAPHEQILRYIAENDVDMVVMGTHGRTGLERTLIGSVTERVVRGSEVPVVTVSLKPTQPEVTDEAEAKAIVTEALEERGYTDVTICEGTYRQRSSWVVQAEAGERMFNVYVDNETGEPHVVDITSE